MRGIFGKGKVRRKVPVHGKAGGSRSERLEDRVLLSVSASVSSGTLDVLLNAAGDTANLGVDAGGHIVVTDGHGATVFSIAAANVSSVNAAGNSAVNQTLNVDGSLNLPGSVQTAGLTQDNFNAVVTTGTATLIASSIAINSSLTASNNGASLFANGAAPSGGKIVVGAGATLSSGGHPITLQAATFVIDGVVNSGSGDVTYYLAPAASVAGAFQQTISSGTVTFSRPASSGSLSFGGATGAGLSGTLLLELPGISFSTPGLDTSAGKASLQINADSIDATGPINTGGATLTLNATNVTLAAAVTAGPVNVGATNSITISAALTASGAMNLLADSDSNNSGTFQVTSSGSVNSSGHNIGIHGAAIGLAGAVNAGAGDVHYAFSPSFSSSSVLANTISSGTVTFGQATDTAVGNLVIGTGAGLTGTLELQFPAAALTINGLDSSGGNASVGITAASVTLNVAVKTGTGTLTIVANGGDLIVGAPITTAALVASATNNIAVSASVTSAGQITLNADDDSNNIGTLSVAPGATVNSNGHSIQTSQASLAIGGTVNAGVGSIDFVFSPVAALGSLGDTISSGPVTLSFPNSVGPAGLTLAFDAGITGTVKISAPKSPFSTSGLDSTAGNANLVLDASSITLGGPVKSGKGSVTLTATTGSITQTAGTIAGSELAARAVTGIGAAAAPVNTVVGSLTAQTATGGIYIHNTGVLLITGAGSTLRGVQVTTSGDISLVNAGSLFINAAADTVHGPGNITVEADGVAADVVAAGNNTGANSAFVSDGGSLTLRAGRDVLLGQTANLQPGSVLVTKTGALSLQAGRDVVLDVGSQVNNDGPGGITVSAGRNITLQQTNNITGAHIFNVDFADARGAISLSAPAGTITLNSGPPSGQSGVRSLDGGVTLTAANMVIADDVTDDIRSIVLQASNSAQIAPGVSFDGGQVTFLGGGKFEVNADISGSNVLNSPDLIVQGPGTMTDFNTSEHLQSLRLESGSIANLAPGGLVVLSIGLDGFGITDAGSKLDLADDTIRIHYVGPTLDPINRVRQYVASGYAGGAWNGDGIFTSLHDAHHGIGFADSADGVVSPFAADTILITRALYGDANLDGKVNFTDLVTLAAHYGKLSGASWDLGDFNYDGKVNFTDLVTLAANYGAGTAPATPTGALALPRLRFAPLARPRRR